MSRYTYIVCLEYFYKSQNTTIFMLSELKISDGFE